MTLLTLEGVFALMVLVVALVGTLLKEFTTFEFAVMFMLNQIWLATIQMRKDNEQY